MEMKHVRTWVFVSAALLMLPLAHVLHLESNASASLVQPFRSDLLLGATPIIPRLDLLGKLDKAVIVNYTVGHNEDIWSICQRYHIDQFTIRSSNDLDTGMVAPGSILRIPNHKGTLYQVSTPETLQSISQGFNRGQRLGAAYQREILEANGFPRPDLRLKDYPFDKGTVLFLPDAWKPTGLQPPFSMKYLTSGFGMRRHPVLGITRRHDGFDLARPYGSPVTVTRAGVVVFAGWRGGYGNLIQIRHVLRNGHVQYTLYGHLSKILVHEGQHVHMYQLIGKVGSTGISTGPHLHYEIRDENNRAINPSRFM